MLKQSVQRQQWQFGLTATLRKLEWPNGRAIGSSHQRTFATRRQIITKTAGLASRNISLWKTAEDEAVKARRWTFRFLGMSTLFVVLVTAGFFAYDASTYHPRGLKNEWQAPKLALHPETGGAKNLPIAREVLGDEDTEEDHRLTSKPKLVILGSGWSAVAILQTLDRDKYHIVLVSPVNYFLFTPLLPSATVGTVNLRSLIEPIRRMCSRARAHFIQAKALDIDLSAKMVECSQVDPKTGQEHNFYVPYDKLIVAVGSETNTHNAEGAEKCHFLKGVADARQIRLHILENLELACLPTTTEAERKQLLSFVVCGGGPTGVEFAAELVDAFKEDVAPHFPKILSADTNVHILQSASHILNTYEKKISEFAEKKFAEDSIHVVTGARVKKVEDDRVIYTIKNDQGEVEERVVPAGIVLWSTGVGKTHIGDITSSFYRSCRPHQATPGTSS